jgi:hypothetical protein
MPLETDYINPDVILTTRVSSDFKDQVKYVKCGALLLLTILICFSGPIDAFGWILLTLAAWWGALWYLKRRPTIVLEGRNRKIHLSGITKFGKPQTLPHNLVEKVTVMEDVLGRARGQYVPQLVLKGFKGGGKKLIINCFPVEDIIQAHYTAQLLANFCRVDAFDYKGSQLPILSTYIPTRFRVTKNETLKSVASKMPKPKTQSRKAGAQKTTT